MVVVSPTNNTVLKLLSSFTRTGLNYRLLKYCVISEIPDGFLVFNILTRELVLLSVDEYDHILESDYLKSHWFVVPDSLNDKEFADLVKHYMSSRPKKSKVINEYTIFTTTDCNARCFYCFELGRSRVPMSAETADKVLRFIINHCGDKRVKLSWFGGEPLLNYQVIDIISDGLQKAGIEYVSRMTSNGYLFSDILVDKAANLWNLKRVQITLDGTEITYNKIKAYIYKEGNPYHIVLDNIERLLNASIGVTIRLNMDLHNSDDLLHLAQQLADRFKGRNGLRVYAHHIFKMGVPMAQMHTPEEWEMRDNAMLRIEQTLECAGLSSNAGVSKKFKASHCMADNGSAVTILPDGSIGLCEHYTESEFIGHIDNETFNEDLIASWKERIPEVPECVDCFYYPQCIKLKKCTNASECYSHFRKNTYRAVQRQMRNEYINFGMHTKNDDSYFPDEG